jgi:hypothetical protein
MVTVGAKQDSCSPGQALAISSEYRAAFNGNRQGPFDGLVAVRVPLGNVCFNAGNPQQAGNNYNDSSAAGASVSKQAQSSLRQSTTN